MKKVKYVILALMVLLAGSAFADDLPERYHTYQEVLDTLTDLQGSFSSIMSVDTMGYSTRDSIPMLLVKISDNVAVSEDEPAVLFNGGVHADEILGAEVAINFVLDILDKYDSSDPDIISYINQLEIFVVPFNNPEGHIVVENGDLDWRKNKSDNDDNDIFDYHDGVDNNRNYDFGWSIDDGVGATTPESLMFKGFAPFSENENVALADFGWQYRPIIAIDYHSPTYGRPNVAYYPWYWYSSEGGHGYGPDESFMNDVCWDFCDLIVAVPDTTGNPDGIHYEARRALVNKGDLKTYFYGNFGSVAFSVEVSDTTIQNPALVDSIVEAHLDGQYYLLDRALGSGITGRIRDSATLEPLEAEVQVLQHINDDINPRLSRPDYGRYHRLLASGSYTLRFLKDGYQTQTIYNVSVGSSGPTTTDVLLVSNNPVPPSPNLIAPSDYAIIETEYVDFSWEAASTATGYVIEIAYDVGFSSMVEYDSTVTGLTYQNTGAFSEDDYYWRCTAYNGNGYSGRSEVRHFEIQLSPPPPPVPVPIYPIGITVDTSHVTFDWGVSTGADGYVFELSSNPAFSSIIEYDSTVSPSEYENSSPLSDGVYYWRVSAYNGNGYSDPSSVSSFTVEIIVPVPDVPVLIYPVDTTVDTSIVTFDWGDADGADDYVFELATDAGFSTIIERDSAVALSEYENSTPLSDGDYYWRITARNGYGYSDPSTVAWFQVEITIPLPDVPALVFPIDTTVDTSIVTFDWGDSDGADDYVFELASDVGFSNTIEYDSAVVLSECENSSILADGIYYWRVTAHNTYGYSNPSAAASFTVELDLPVPVLISPGEGYYSTSPYIDFAWQDISGATNYLIEISDDVGFGSLTIFDSTLTNSEYTNTDSLENGGYFWRAKAYLPPFWGEYCTPWEFYVEADTSSIFYIPGDANGDLLVIGSDVTFLVNYFRGITTPPIEVDGFYPGADANGDCRNIGSDVTYLVTYFRGGNSPIDGHCF
ncbi:MAG: hypothetical protein GY839_00945 [candidate division Zixibacteria bacterium]|nr:hypothetical protein [candidate division Zixibacteria bacterium]